MDLAQVQLTASKINVYYAMVVEIVNGNLIVQITEISNSGNFMPLAILCA